MLHLDLPSATYFRYLDLLFKFERESISGNGFTWSRLFNETLILNQRYLKTARKFQEIADDKNQDGEVRLEALSRAAHLHRAAHDMMYFGPSYLRVKGKLPPHESPAQDTDKSLPFTHVGPDDKDYTNELQILQEAEAYRKEEIEKKQEQKTNLTDYENQE